MSHTKAGVARFVATDDERGGFRITILPRGFGLSTYIIGGILGSVLAVSVLTAVASFRDRGDPFTAASCLAFLVAVASLVGLFVVHHATRREIIGIEGDFLTLRHEWAWGGWSETFARDEIRDLRVSARDTLESPAVGTITFEYGPETVVIGPELPVDELKRVVRTILVRFPVRDGIDEVKPLPVTRLS